MEKIEALETVGKYLLSGEQETAKMLIYEQYPFRHMEATGRAYTDKQKLQQFKRDGFIDRYSGQKLVNPGFLKVLSHYMPEEFPYHSHWKIHISRNGTDYRVN